MKRILMLILVAFALVSVASAFEVLTIIPRYASPVQVGTVVNVSFDLYGVNETRPNADVSLSTTGDQSWFEPSRADHLNLTAVDGTVSVQFFAGRVGVNYIVAQTDGAITTVGIEARATGIPARINATASPEWVYSDGDASSVFAVNFEAFDALGYPSGQRDFVVFTSVHGESETLRSNNYGFITLTYGPKVASGVYTITARAVDNASATTSINVRFVSTAATDMFLTAVPQTMPSTDVKPDSESLVIAKTVDIRGNPVSGEPVRMRIISVTSSNSSVTPPTLDGHGFMEDVYVDTDNGESGEAIAHFVPGSFITPGNPGYEQFASGEAVVEAQWDGITRQIALHWENYPYLSLTVDTEPVIVEKGGTVDITIRILGDGYALRPKPIDAILTTDRSGSMLKDLPDRMVMVKDASKVFVAQFDYTQDKIGVVSFGTSGTANIMQYGNKIWSGRDDRTSDDFSYKVAHYPSDPKYYGDYATVDIPLSSTAGAVNASIDTLTPDQGTPMRYAIYTSINEVVAHGRPGTVKAIVVLSDGDYNWYGDPLARGSYGNYDPTSYTDLTTRYQMFPGASSQNMSAYANTNGVKIFTIAFAQDISSGGRDTLQKLAVQTGGKYYYAPSAAQLNEIYTDIAGQLKTDAGIGVVMNLDMGNVVLNNRTVPGSQAYDYVYLDGISTTIQSWNATTTIEPLHTIDQTHDWVNNKSLLFNVGTIKLGQTWEAKYRLRVKEVGTIGVFSPSARIVFNGGITEYLPDTYINVLDTSAGHGVGKSGIDIHDLHALRTMPVTRSVEIMWNLTYTGNGTVTHSLYMARNATPDQWVPIGVRTVVKPGKESQLGTVLDFEGWQLHGTLKSYLVRVDAVGSDGGYDSEQTAVDVWIPKYYIKIS